MSQQTNQTRLLKMLDQLELDLSELRRALTMSHSQSKRKTGTKRKVSRSLYGVFPRSDATMQDFRQARQNWSRRLRG